MSKLQVFYVDYYSLIIYLHGILFDLWSPSSVCNDSHIYLSVLVIQRLLYMPKIVRYSKFCHTTPSNPSLHSSWQERKSIKLTSASTRLFIFSLYAHNCFFQNVMGEKFQKSFKINNIYVFVNIGMLYIYEKMWLFGLLLCLNYVVSCGIQWIIGM